MHINVMCMYGLTVREISKYGCYNIMWFCWSDAKRMVSGLHHISDKDALTLYFWMFNFWFKMISLLWKKIVSLLYYMILIYCTCCLIYWWYLWLHARLWYLQCICMGNTIALCSPSIFDYFIILFFLGFVDIVPYLMISYLLIYFHILWFGVCWCHFPYLLIRFSLSVMNYIH